MHKSHLKFLKWQMLYYKDEYNIPVKKYGLKRPICCFAISVV